MDVKDFFFLHSAGLGHKKLFFGKKNTGKKAEITVFPIPPPHPPSFPPLNLPTTPTFPSSPQVWK